jgi:hypothetical protein
VEDIEAMPDLISEEIPLAQQIAYQKSLARSDGQHPPSYSPEATVGDFRQAAGEVIARRGQSDAPTNRQVFTLELLQTINDWQRGGNAKEKNERGKKLREVATSLPEKFRQTNVTCYRRLKLHKSFVWNLGTDEELAETVSAWTESEDVAMGFKRRRSRSGFSWGDLQNQSWRRERRPQSLTALQGRRIPKGNHRE